jgi:hypothetical protein
MSVAEMRMLCWICGHTRKDQIRNDDIRDKLGDNTNSREVSPTLFAMVWSYPTKPHEAPVRSGILIRPENTRRGRGRPRLTWEEAIKRDLKE